MKESLSNVPIDFVKLGVLLYLLGIFTSALYFSRYSILALDFAKPQSIVVGCYILFLYLGLPALFLLALRKLHRTAVQIVLFCLSLLVKNMAVLFLLSYRSWRLIGLALLTSFIELLFFLDLTLLTSSNSRRAQLSIFPIARLKVLLFTLIFSIHFAIFLFPFIPSSLAGAKPLRVHVFAKTTDLPGSRFVLSKNQPKINSKIDSFALYLFYESDKDLYFLEERVSSSGLEGYSVMRIRRDEILRIDYVTPKWIAVKGGLE